MWNEQDLVNELSFKTSLGDLRTVIRHKLYITGGAASPHCERLLLASSELQKAIQKNGYTQRKFSILMLCIS